MRARLQNIYDVFLQHPVITTDSRKITPGCMFFALKGENFNGNDFAKQAIADGAAYAVIDDKNYKGEKCFLVDNVLQTLQQLAAFHRKQFCIPALAITGSNGKTTTKELVNAVLTTTFNVIATQGNLNNHIGVPLTLLRITKETEIAIIEMGANHQGEIKELCEIAQPNHGLITNIGRAHLGGFGGFQGVVKTKSELYDWLRESNGKAFVNADNALLMERSQGVARILYGTSTQYKTHACEIPSNEFLRLLWNNEGTDYTIDTQLIGNYNFENALAAISVAMEFGVEPKQIVEAIKQYKPSNSRSQAVKTAHNSLILDAYNANPTSMLAAITNFVNVKTAPKMLILGDMLELGDESLTEHADIVKKLQNEGFTNVVLVGTEFSKVAPPEYHKFLNSTDARAWLEQHPVNNFTILIKGSRGIQLEKVLDVL